MVFVKYFFVFLLTIVCFSFTNTQHPFNYDLHIYSIPGTNHRTMLCMHGKGGDYSIAQKVKESCQMQDTLVSFNFPDYGIRPGQKSFEEIKYGSIDELLPAIYVLKKLVVDEGLTEINLYGFSSGGGALINSLSVLNSTTYDTQLKKMGITQKEKEKILSAIQKGHIILDTPLKSLREIIALQGPQSELLPFEKKYRENHMEPIDSLQNLEPLILNIWLHFQKPDEVLSNRDDELYIERLKKYNSLGKTRVIIGYDTGHKLPHPTLWKAYMQDNQSYRVENANNKTILGIKVRTSNKDHREDASLLWERFKREKVSDRIGNKLSDKIYAVYANYEKDFTCPYDYFIGYEVSDLNNIPSGLISIDIQEGLYAIFSAQGKFPFSLIQTWQTIWKSPIKRSYLTDYEVYPSNFDNENSLGLSVFVSVKENF